MSISEGGQVSGFRRLNVVVPYRDREEHLKRFVPRVRAYFARDKIDRNIPYRVLIVEQEEGLPFNRGAINNVGFLLGREQSDYTCFHDVDYLPVWADYTWSNTPVCIVWYGAESRPISLKDPDRRVMHDIEGFHSAVTLNPNTLFEGVNGYSNTYWGWGWEDTDLKRRYEAAGIAFMRRKGTFQPLDHDHNGYDFDTRLKPEAVANQQRFNDRWASGLRPQGDGLQTLSFEVLDRRAVPEGSVIERPATWEIVKVRLKMVPRGLHELEAPPTHQSSKTWPHPWPGPARDRPSARSAATNCVPAAWARSTSDAMASSLPFSRNKIPGRIADPAPREFQFQAPK